MRFHSLDFLIFLPLVLGIYWLLPRKGQNLFLLAASYFFYGYIHPWFLTLIMTSTVLDYSCALAMKRFPDKKKVFLWASIAGNLGMLGVFKYTNFFIENIYSVLNLMGVGVSYRTLAIFLPPGISFYTFQTLSYTIDVYRGRCQPRRNFIDVATFVSFFPQLVAGPIERARNLLPQFEGHRSLSVPEVRAALVLIVWGFYKKVVIADTVAIYCNKIFALQSPEFWLIWAGTFAFYIQIFADFSAYSSIARGTASLFGIKLMLNFNHPYISRSTSEFWQRWHISLSTWLRDYVSISLHQSPWWKRHRNWNIMITFLLCGLWHGASWNFVLWGGYCGLTLITYGYYQTIVKKIFRFNIWCSMVNWITMFFLINVAFLIFRERDLSFLWRHLLLNPFDTSFAQSRAAIQVFILTFLYSLPIWIHAWYDLWLKKRLRRHHHWQKIEFALQIIVSIALFIGILILHSTEKVDFIYFQF